MLKRVRSKVGRRAFAMAILGMMCVGLIRTSAATTPSITFADEAWGRDERSLLTARPQFLPDNWRELVNLGPPPGPIATKQEIASLWKLVEARHQHYSAITRQAPDGDADFETALGITLNDHPLIRDLMHAVALDTVIAVLHFKNKFKRGRPWQVDPTLTPLIAPPLHPSYPSGHATQAITIAAALVQLFPACRIQLDRLAIEIGQNREIAGVHYASDTAAGRRLAAQLNKLFRKSKLFKALLARARTALPPIARCQSPENVPTSMH